MPITEHRRAGCRIRTLTVPPSVRGAAEPARGRRGGRRTEKVVSRVAGLDALRRKR
jgi:hypothetical protein